MFATLKITLLIGSNGDTKYLAVKSTNQKTVFKNILPGTEPLKLTQVGSFYFSKLSKFPIFKNFELKMTFLSRECPILRVWKYKLQRRFLDHLPVLHWTWKIIEHLSRPIFWNILIFWRFSSSCLCWTSIKCQKLE